MTSIGKYLRRRMKTELSCACEFLARILLSKNLPIQFIKPFSKRLEELLEARYRDHWHPENPRKGSAYRCIRINGRMDPVISEAAKVTGLSNIARYLPKEFTMWIDPNEVSYRFGEDGSICQCPLNPTTELDDYLFSETVRCESTDWSAKPVPRPSFFNMYPNSMSSPTLTFETPISVRV